jgi:diacylglycerol kinase
MNRKLTTKTDLAKRAKDLGSAAVLVSIVFAIVLWVGADNETAALRLEEGDR